MKPENVFLTGDLEMPVVKVIDFGISKVAEEGGQSLTKTGMIMGTPSYMAPEQARGERVDHRVDIYAVGAILYELVTGKRPFDKVDPTATITAVLLEEPERPCALNPSVPEALEMVIQRAMAKSPADRYQSMSELEAQLASFEEGDSGVARAMTNLGGADPWAGGPGSMRRSATLERGSHAALDSRQRDVSQSRPTIALMGGLAAFGVLAGLVTATAAVIRMVRGGGAGANVTGSESLLLVVLLALALATPLGFSVHYLRKNVWNNSAKTVELAMTLRRVIVAVFITYGVTSLTIRFTESILLRRAAGVAWPTWDVVATVVAITAGVAAHFVARREASSRR
jgi:serine/threonine-protein kinase